MGCLFYGWQRCPFKTPQLEYSGVVNLPSAQTHSKEALSPKNCSSGLLTKPEPHILQLTLQASVFILTRNVFRSNHLRQHGTEISYHSDSFSGWSSSDVWKHDIPNVEGSATWWLCSHLSSHFDLCLSWKPSTSHGNQGNQLAAQSQEWAVVTLGGERGQRSGGSGKGTWAWIWSHFLICTYGIL